MLPAYSLSDFGASDALQYLPLFISAAAKHFTLRCANAERVRDSALNSPASFVSLPRIFRPTARHLDRERAASRHLLRHKCKPATIRFR